MTKMVKIIRTEEKERKNGEKKDKTTRDYSCVKISRE